MLVGLNLTLEEKKTKYGYDFTFLYELKSNFQWASDAKDAGNRKKQCGLWLNSNPAGESCLCARGHHTADYQDI